MDNKEKEAIKQCMKNSWHTPRCIEKIIYRNGIASIVYIPIPSRYIGSHSMSTHEKMMRCGNAPERYTEVVINGEEVTEIQCRVYTRWVSNCYDCSFNVSDRNTTRWWKRTVCQQVSHHTL